MEAVKSSELGINQSALKSGVPKTTLKDRTAGRVKQCTKPGPVACLDSKEEEELVNFVFENSKIRYGKTKREVLQIVEDAAKKKSIVIKGHISDGWLYHLCQRWPKVWGDPFSQA